MNDMEHIDYNIKIPQRPLRARLPPQEKLIHNIEARQQETQQEEPQQEEPLQPHLLPQQETQQKEPPRPLRIPQKIVPTHYELKTIIDTPFSYDKVCITATDIFNKQQKQKEHERAVKEAKEKIILHTTQVKHENIEHTDARNTLFIGEECKNKATGGITFKREGCYNKNDYVLLKKRCEGYNYVEQHITNISELKNDKNYYEVCCSGKQLKLAFDLDDKENGILINEVIEFCELFKNYIEGKMDIIDCITYEILISVEPNEDFDSIKSYQSYHIIYNVYTNYYKIHNFHKEIVCDFLNENGKSINFYTKNNKSVDTTIYSAGKYLRAIGQSKGKIYNNPYCGDFSIKNVRTDIFKALDITTGKFKTEINSDMFVMIFNKDTDIFYDYIPLDKTTKIYEEYNICYVIPYINDIISIWINELNEYQLTSEWIENLYYIIHLLRITGTKWDEIQDHKIINEFLEISQVGRYSDLKHKANNIQLIKNIIEKQSIERTDFVNKVFNNKIKTRELCDIEIKEIYKHLKKEPTDKVYLVLQKSIGYVIKTATMYAYEIKTDNYNLTTRGDIKMNEGHLKINMGKEKQTIYDKLYTTDTKTILTNAVICWKEKIIKSIQSQEHNVIVKYINNLSQEELQLNKETSEGSRNHFITDWKDKRLIELNKKSDLSLILEAPTSSGKTYFQMRERIIYVLGTLYKKRKQQRRICVLTDTRSLANATTEMITKIFIDLDIPLSYFKNYLGYVKEADGDKKNIQNENTLLLLVCVDSLNKYTDRFNKQENLFFTDLIIDEYQNISNGILKSITNDYKQTTYQKTIMNSFYNQIRITESVSIYDADINGYDRELLKKYTGKTFDYVRYVDFKQKTKKAILMGVNKMKEEMIHNYKLGKPQSLSVSTKKEAVEMYDMFLKMGLGKQNPIVVMTGEGGIDSRENERKESDKLKNKLCGDTTLWRDYKLIIYNSTITTGISENTPYGEIPHFYTHYSLIIAEASDTPNAVAKAQMDMRVRQTQTSIMRIAIKSDTMNTLQIKKKKDYDFNIKKQIAEIKNLIYRQSKNYTNGNTDITIPPKLQEQLITIKNLKETSMNYKSTAQEKANAKASLKDSFNKLTEWDKEEQLFLEISTRKSRNIDFHNKEFIAIYLKLLKKWGVEEITTELYENITPYEVEQLNKQDKDAYIYTAEQYGFEKFNIERKICDYTDKTKNYDNNMSDLLSIGYSPYQSKLYGKKEPYFNGIAYYLIQNKYSTKKASGAYTKLFDYYYYDIMREMLLKSVLKDIDEKSTKELERTGSILKNDIMYICNACIMFELLKCGYLRKDKKICDYKEFMSDMVEKRKGEYQLYNKQELKNGLIKELKPLLKYLFISGKFKVIIPHSNFEKIRTNDYIAESFNYFNTEITIEKDNTLLFVAKKGTPFRLQKNNYDIEREKLDNEKLLITNTDIDEYKNENTEDYITDSDLIIMKSYMPKIQSKAHKINGRLYDLISHYVIKDKQPPLFEKLAEIHKNYKDTHISIPYEEAKKIQDDYDRLYEKAEIKEDDYYTTIGGIKAPHINKCEVMKEAKRFYKWKVCENGGVYNENGEPQKIVIIENSNPVYSERQGVSYKDGFEYKKKYEVNESYCVYRNRLFNLKCVIAEAFMTEYDSEKSYIIPIDKDHSNNALINLRIINDEAEFKLYKKGLKEEVSSVKKQAKKTKQKEKAKEKIICEICGGKYIISHKSTHLKTAKHLKKSGTPPNIFSV